VTQSAGSTEQSERTRASSRGARARPARPSPGTALGERERQSVAELEPVLGRRFARPEWLVEALTHRSYAYEFAAPGVSSNERLEFLGDAVLGFLSADLLFALAPGASEGELTTARAALVRASTLAALARRIELGRHLRLGRGEEATGGRERDRLLASALEAVLGALYLEGGLDAVRAFLEPLQRAEAERVLRSRQLQDDKSLLQQLAQARLGVTPSYRVAMAEGPSHARTFTVEVLVGDRVVASGVGPNKRQAEQMAAQRALEEDGWLSEPDGGRPPDETDAPDSL
jgi:ribonuclease-3